MRLRESVDISYLPNVVYDTGWTGYVSLEVKESKLDMKDEVQ